MWEGKNVKFRKMSLDGMDDISVWFADWCARACVAEQGREISIFSQLEPSWCVISPNSTIVQTTRPLNGQRRSINPTSWFDSHQEGWEQRVTKEKGYAQCDLYPGYTSE